MLSVYPFTMPQHRGNYITTAPDTELLQNTHISRNDTLIIAKHNQADDPEQQDSKTWSTGSAWSSD